MAIALPQQIYNQFKGIREVNGANQGGQLSALSAVNVEFFNSDIGNGVGLRSSNGSKIYKSLPDGFSGIKCFSSVQDGAEYLLVYAENEMKGVLYYYDSSGNRFTALDNLSVTGKANGITMQYGEYDVFVFTNGDVAYSVCFAQNPITKVINAIDNQSRTIKWLSMAEWNGFLVVASQYGVHASHKNNIYKWNDTVTSENQTVASWYVDFGKKVTAVASFATGLFIFTEDDISHLNASPNVPTSALSSVAMNGCFSFESLVSHGTYLFFYDNKQKNIYYIKQTDTGLTQPAGPVALEVQSFFNGKIDRFKMYSCIYAGNNEIWLIVNNKVLIFDYVQQEFTERQQTAINDICLFNNFVYSVNAEGEIRREKDTGYNQTYYPSEFRSSIINLGSNTNLKKEKTPLLLVLNANYVNDFYVQLTANYKDKNPKHILYKVANQGIFPVDGTPEEELTPNMKFGYVDEQGKEHPNAYWADDNPYKKTVVEVSTPQTWYTLSIRIFTETEGQGFSIESIELKRLKEKTKTKGR